MLISQDTCPKSHLIPKDDFTLPAFEGMNSMQIIHFSPNQGPQSKIKEEKTT